MKRNKLIVSIERWSKRTFTKHNLKMLRRRIKNVLGQVMASTRLLFYRGDYVLTLVDKNDRLKTPPVVHVHVKCDFINSFYVTNKIMPDLVSTLQKDNTKTYGEYKYITKEDEDTQG